MQELSVQQPIERQPPSSEEEKTPAPRIAGRYEVINKLSGGMAFVYLCRDHQTNRPVALKIFKPELLSHRVARDLFLREGTMWVELGHHPNIVRAYRVERIGDGREVYLVLEWVVQPKGKATPALRSWLFPGRPLPLEQALVFTLGVARGMRFATQKIKGLVHRDLKPENILIGHDGRAKVTDFGLASTLSGMSTQMESFSPTSDDFGRTQLTQGVVGTPLYMAPEQWRHKLLDERADIYALGCIFYEMITGRFAAVGRSREDLKEIHLAGRIKPPPSTMPKEVVKFLRKCLVADRNQRFSEWAEVEGALEKVYSTVTGKAPPPERVTANETQAERLAAGRSYNDMGLSYLDIGKLDVAVMYFEQSVGIGRVEGSVELEGEGLGNLGIAYMALGYIERAIEFHDEHLTIARGTGDQAEEARALGNLGRAYRRLGDVDRAASFHQQELEIARELNNRYLEAAALDSLGDSYWRLGDKSKAVSHFKQSLTIARGIGDQSRVKSVLNNMGRVYLASNEMKEASTLFRQSYDIARKMGDHIGEGEALGDLGDLQFALKDIERATELYRRALLISQESKDRRKEVRNLTRMGDLYFSQDDTEEAKEYYESALEAIHEIGDRSIELQAIDKLGRVNIVLGDFMQAASLYRRMLEMAQEMGDWTTQQQALLRLGESYELWGDLRRKADYLKQYLEISREIDDRKGEISMLNTLAEVYREMRDLKSARKIYEEYLGIAREMRDHVAISDALNKLGDVAREHAKIDEAVEYYKQALDIAQQKQNLVGEATALGNLSVTYNDLGKKWQANRHGEKAVKTAIKTKDGKTVAWARYKFALVLFSHKKWSKALSHAKQSKRIFTKIGDEEQAERMDLLIQRSQQQMK